MISPNGPRRVWPIPTTALIVGALLASVACTGGDSKASDSHAVVAATQRRGQPRFTAADFAHLAWLAGDWRSRTPDGKWFYDRYRVIDDSTMKEAGFSDSTFRTQKDSAVIGLRAGVVLDRSNGAPWVATGIDTNSASFESQAAAANHFVWTRQSSDRWTTQIFTTDRKGVETRTVFQVERAKK